MSQRSTILITTLLLGLMVAGCSEKMEDSEAYQAACQGPPLRTGGLRNKAMEDGYNINLQYNCIDKASFVAENERIAKWEAANTPEAVAKRNAGFAELRARDDEQHARKTAADISTNKLDELAKLPLGLQVVHTPDKVRAEIGGRSGRGYTWTYKTSVTSTNGSVVVKEFGAFVWQNGNWAIANFTGKPFTSADFAEWYSCPGANLAEGKEVSDSSNWSGGDILQGGKMKWYFIGTASDGRTIKGEAVVETLPEVFKK